MAQTNWIVIRDVIGAPVSFYTLSGRWSEEYPDAHQMGKAQAVAIARREEAQAVSGYGTNDVTHILPARRQE